MHLISFGFLFRFYIESISYLKDNATIELFFLNAKSCIYKVRTLRAMDGSESGLRHVDLHPVTQSALAAELHAYSVIREASCNTIELQPRSALRAAERRPERFPPEEGGSGCAGCGRAPSSGVGDEECV